MIKSICCCCRAPTFSFQDPHGSSQRPETPVPEYVTPLVISCTHMAHIHTYIHKFFLIVASYPIAFPSLLHAHFNHSDPGSLLHWRWYQWPLGLCTSRAWWCINTTSGSSNQTSCYTSKILIQETRKHIQNSLFRYPGLTLQPPAH